MKAPIVIRNDTAVVGWIFMAIWTSGVCLMTWGYTVQGGFGQFDPLIEAGVVLLFWVFTLGGLAELATRPRTRLTIDPAGVVLTRIWMFRRREERLDRSILSGVTIATERQEGDDLYRLDLALPSGEQVAIRHSSSRLEIEDLRRELMRRA